jgi:hypothetical protein
LQCQLESISDLTASLTLFDSLTCYTISTTNSRLLFFQDLSTLQSEKKSLVAKLAHLEKELQGSKDGEKAAAERSQTAAAKEIASLKAKQVDLQRQIEELQAK